MSYPRFRTEPDEDLLAALKELPPIIRELVDAITRVMMEVSVS